MGHAFHQLYYHFVWSTYSRIPLIRRDYRPDFLKIINEEAKKRGGWLIRHNAMPDHVHLLVRLPPTVKVTDFIGQIKGASAHRINIELQPSFKLQWQEGYGALTIREDDVAKVSRYIDNQETHHQTGKVSDLLEKTAGDEDQGDCDIPPPEGG